MLQSTCGRGYGYSQSKQIRSASRNNHRKVPQKKTYKTNLLTDIKLMIVAHMGCGRKNIRVSEVARKLDEKEKAVAKAFMRLVHDGILDRDERQGNADSYRIIKRPRIEDEELETVYL
mgnify:CR=1 FL=1